MNCSTKARKYKDNSMVMLLFVFDDVENEKEKLSGDDVDSRGGVSGLGPSAALTPAIWDKTIPYDGKTFHLEYMDLEEFLMENGISASEQVQQKTIAKENSKQLLEESSPIIPKTEPSQAAPISLLPTLELEQCDEVITSVVSNLDSPQTKTGQYRIEMSDSGHDHRQTVIITCHQMYFLMDLVISSLVGSGVYEVLVK